LQPLRVREIKVRRPRWLTPGLLWRLSASGLSPAVILGYAYGLDASSLPKAGLVVSAGGDTLAANVAAARLLGAPNIFYGSLRRYNPHAFALVLTSYARNAGKPNHAMTLKPNRLDPDQLGPSPARAYPNEAPALAGLLVGGDAGTVRFTEADWRQLLVFLTSTFRTSGTRWIVSNSPRSPATISDELSRLSKDRDGPIADFIDVRSAGPGTLQALFARSAAILCTADSSSMLSEAVWARRPAVALLPAHITLPADEQDYRQYLEDNGWATALPIAGLTPDRVWAALGTIRPLAENPLDRLAGLLSANLPDVFERRA
jgi:mitochondrial fission protein ELM1